MDKMLGVYIHIPFCPSRCGYCDFCSVAGGEDLMPRYQTAIIKHIEESQFLLSRYYVDTVYFGGGTPSYYGARRIAGIFDALKRTGRVLKNAEVTVELNPDSVNKGELAQMRKAGVNRLSIGVQSADNELLKLMGRRHSFKQAETAVKTAREAGFKNISIDLIYGIPTQSKGDWVDTLTKAMALRPEHISCYGLKLEPGTPMYSYKDSPFLPGDDEQADMYLYTTETLERHGYAQYEISNFAQKGAQSRHNLKYWKLEDYAGFGASAHSFTGSARYSFVSDVPRYIKGVLDGKSIIDEYEEVSRLDYAAEYIMLGMRTAQGISRDEYKGLYRSDFDVIEDMLEDFESSGWAKKTGERWSFTTSGFLLSNVLIGMLLEAQAEQKFTTGAQDITNREIKVPAGSAIYD